LADALRVNGSLTKIGEGGLDLRYNSIGEEGWAAIIGAVCSSTVSKISTIDASSKGITVAGAKLIAESLKTSVNGSITSLNLRGNNIGAEGAKPLADALRVNGSITKVCLQHNRLDDDAKQLLTDANNKRTTPAILEL